MTFIAKCTSYTNVTKTTVLIIIQRDFYDQPVNPVKPGGPGQPCAPGPPLKPTPLTNASSNVKIPKKFKMRLFYNAF